MRKQVVIFGLGRFGVSVARTLTKIGHEVLAIDKEEKEIQDISEFVTDAAQADGTDEQALRELGVGDFEIAVVAVGRDIPTSLMTTVLLKKLGVPHVIVRATTDLHGATLEKIGADRVVFPERDTGERIAHSLTASNVTDYIGLTTDYGIGKVIALDEFVSHTLEEIGLSGNGTDNIRVLLIHRGNNYIVAPDRFERIVAGDVLVLSGRDDDLERLTSPDQI
jgi:trk system potassium uptake protein TrkA